MFGIEAKSSSKELTVINRALKKSELKELIETSAANDEIAVFSRNAARNSLIALSLPERVSRVELMSVQYDGDGELDESLLLMEKSYSEFEKGPRQFYINGINRTSLAKRASRLSPGNYRFFLRVSHYDGTTLDFTFEVRVMNFSIDSFGTGFKTIASTEWLIQITPSCLVFFYRAPLIHKSNGNGADWARPGDVNDESLFFAPMGIGSIAEPFDRIVDGEVIRIDDREFIIELHEKGDVIAYHAGTLQVVATARLADSFLYGRDRLFRLEKEDRFVINRLSESHVYTLEQKDNRFELVRTADTVSEFNPLKAQSGAVEIVMDPEVNAYYENGEKKQIVELSEADFAANYQVCRLLPPLHDRDKVQFGVSTYFHSLIEFDADNGYFHFKVPKSNCVNYSHLLLYNVQGDFYFGSKVDNPLGRFFITEAFGVLSRVIHTRAHKKADVIENVGDVITADWSTFPDSKSILTVGDKSGVLHLVYWDGKNHLKNSYKLGSPQESLLLDDGSKRVDSRIMASLVLYRHVVTATIDQRLFFHNIVEKEDESGIFLDEICVKELSDEVQDLVHLKGDQLLAVFGSGLLCVYDTAGNRLIFNDSYRRQSSGGAPFCLALGSELKKKSARQLFVGLMNGQLLVYTVSDKSGIKGPLAEHRIDDEGSIFHIEPIDHRVIACYLDSGKLVFYDIARKKLLAKEKINMKFLSPKACMFQPGSIHFIPPHIGTTLLQPIYAVAKDQIVLKSGSMVFR